MKIHTLFYSGLIVCGCLLLSHFSAAQTNLKGMQENLNKVWSASRLQEKFSGLDLSRFTMQQSYSMMYASGGNMGGRSYGMYTNVLTYRISDPLELKFKIGYIMEPFAQERMRGGFSNGHFLPGFALQYKPSKNIFLNFTVESFSGYNSPYSSYWMNDGIGRMFDSNP